jgi:glutathionylspermidine synthase
MRRIQVAERPHWRTLAEEVGFHFHTLSGEPYWDESAYYQFTLAQIEEHLESATLTLHHMALDLMDDVVKDEALLSALKIPQPYWEYVAQSWKYREVHLYGRMDLVYDGHTPPKLLELNYDTPTSLFETGFFQWVWLEDLIKMGTLPAHADQFNSLQDQLENAFKHLRLPKPFYFTSVRDHAEDFGTVQYLMDIAAQSGAEVQYIALEDLGELNGQFVDEQDYNIRGLFKLYPWEFMVIEPAWKMVLSNKGILPLLWQKHPNHPLLLPAHFVNEQEAPQAGWVYKPLLSREGANIRIVTNQGEQIETPGPYTSDGFIRQAFQSLPVFNNANTGQKVYPLIGSWVVGNTPAGIGIREDQHLITQNTSRFVPHIFLD